MLVRRILKRAIVIIALTLVVLLPASAAGTQEAADTISFAGSGGYPPFNYLDEEGSVIGFDVDVANEIADRLGKECDYVTTSWDGIIEGLRAGRYDAILGSMGITEERERIVDFSIPYYYSGPQLIVRKDSGLQDPENLPEGFVVGLVTGTTYEQDARDLGVDVRLYEDDNQTLLELIGGRVDGVLTDRIVGLGAIGKLERGGELTLVGSPLRLERMAIAFQADDDGLREQVDGILEQLHADGTLSQISRSWFDGEDITTR